tara:strand:- start:936 stop:2948 length:2013 start_codon:yes stop_codon:yes gene_type:complete
MNNKTINDIIFESEITQFAKLCHDNPEQYSSRHGGTFNWSMSPQTLFYYFKSPNEIERLTKPKKIGRNEKVLIEKDKDIQEIKYKKFESYSKDGWKIIDIWSLVSDNKPYYIGNSKENRDPSTKGDLLNTRMKYIYMGIIGVSDFNFFPASLIDTSDGLQGGEYDYLHLQLKDRGNLTSIVKRYDEAILTVTEWDKLITKIEEDNTYAHKLKNERCQEIMGETKELLKTFTSAKDRATKKLSLKDVLGDDVFNEWYYDSRAINLRVKFESFGIHCEEMMHYNNTELGWCEYNHLSTDCGLMARYFPDQYDSTGLDKVHSLCKDEDVFLGNKPFLKKVKHRTKEGFESWFPIDYTACEHLDWNTFINQFCRSTQTGTKVKINSWESLLSKKNENGDFIMVDTCKNNIDLIKKISKLPEVSIYENTLAEMVKNDSSLQQHNVSQLILEKHDNVAIVVRAIKEISKFIHKKRDSITRQISIAQHYLDDCKKHMEKGGLDVFVPKSKKHKINIGTMNLWEHFFKPVMETTKKRLNKPDDFNSDDFWLDLKTELAKNNISVGSAPLPVYERPDYGVFVEKDIDFVNQEGMDDCHMDGKKTKTKKNMFVHLSENNQKVQGNVPIKNLKEYMDEFNADLDKWHNKNGGVMDIRVHNTKILNQCVLKVYEKNNKNKRG